MGLTYTIIGTIIIFVATTLGSAMVFVVKKSISNKVKQIIYGFSSGIMFSAAVFGLLVPAFNDKSSTSYMDEKFIWIIPVIGFLLGCLFIYLLDKLIPHIHKNPKGDDIEEGIKNNFSRGNKLFLAVTLHNIPEGLNVGLAFGVALASKDMSSPLFLSALMLSVGMAIQNFPEGAAVSIPLLEEGYSKNKAFWFGTLTGLVEPIAAAIGILLSFQVTQFMPWGLSFAAGCMVYVVIEDLFPELFEHKDCHFGIWAFIVGFVLMMILDSISSI